MESQENFLHSIHCMLKYGKKVSAIKTIFLSSTYVCISVMVGPSCVFLVFVYWIYAVLSVQCHNKKLAFYLMDRYRAPLIPNRKRWGIH